MDSRCVNCGIATTFVRRFSLNDDEPLRLIINQWIAPRTVMHNQHLCPECWTLVNEAFNSNTPLPPRVGHSRVCINCGRSLLRIRSHELQNNTEREAHILNVIQQWNLPHSVTVSNNICHPCWCRADRTVLNVESVPANQNPEEVDVQSNVDVPAPGEFEPTAQSAEVDTQVNIDPPLPTGRPSMHCINCGRSFERNRYHYLTRRTERETRILNVIREWAIPQQVTSSSRICHACWVRADRASVHFVTGPSTSGFQPEAEVLQENTSEALPLIITEETQERQTEAFINLPNYFRAKESERTCFVPRCNNVERHRIPLYLRKKLFTEFKYYVPSNCRICTTHLLCQSWNFITNTFGTSSSQFTAAYIEDFIQLLKNDAESLDFNNIENMEDHLVHYWLGISKQEFTVLLDQVTRLKEMDKGALALAIYLLKLRTGDSNRRISSLTKISLYSLQSLIKKAREVLTEDWVPLYLGLSHITREEIASRNLLIPNGLFGSRGTERVPVSIFDGTYVFVQKSSNYLYQKRTYSLHKYRNLIKMFMIVSTDGHIIDVLGPYPATASDADIMKSEFGEDKPLRQFYHRGDVFILDRGFRDSIPLLNEAGYETQMPASLREGEFQLTTLDANKSRAVTICRWVVEVVNGRFKRDFKIFRQETYNIASKNIAKDFKVAAALLNKFHPPITDRPDAGEILQVIHHNMNRDNILADFVINNNLNMRRSLFRNINADENNVNDFPQLTYSDLVLISVGTYQIKQARSYYGEHIRANGTYTIEVSREGAQDLLQELSTSTTVWLLRARIKSRHSGRKIYYCYILVDSSLAGRNAILGYYCNCKVGKRTVGCCAHIMSIMWYLGYERHRNINIQPPAAFLDDILLIITEND